MSDSASKSSNEKSNLRRQALAARAILSPAERTNFSLKIADAVTHSPWFRRSRNICCYLSVREEVDTWPIIERAWRMRKRTFAPVILENSRMKFLEVTPETELAINQFGIREPISEVSIPARKLDIVLVPLVGFDANRNRIGMGGGYYDRAFSFLRNRDFYFRPKLIGLAFASQQLDKFPPSPWDIPLFRIITELQF